MFREVKRGTVIIPSFNYLQIGLPVFDKGTQ